LALKKSDMGLVTALVVGPALALDTPVGLEPALVLDTALDVEEPALGLGSPRAAATKSLCRWPSSCRFRWQRRVKLLLHSLQWNLSWWEIPTSVKLLPSGMRQVNRLGKSPPSQLYPVAGTYCWEGSAGNSDLLLLQSEG
jgi:hypothetical protein